MADLGIPLPQIDQQAARRNDLDTRVGSVRTREEAQKIAEEFERMFLTEMLQPMFAGLQTEAPFGGGQAEEVFRPMLLDQYAEAVSASGGVGIADAVFSELLRMQGLEE